MPFLAGPRTIAEFIEPAIVKSAVDAGRTKPGIIAQVPVLVSDDIDAAKDFVAEQLSFFEASAADLAAVGFSGIGQASASELSGCGCD